MGILRDLESPLVESIKKLEADKAAAEHELGTIRATLKVNAIRGYFGATSFKDDDSTPSIAIMLNVLETMHKSAEDYKARIKHLESTMILTGDGVVFIHDDDLPKPPADHGAEICRSCQFPKDSLRPRYCVECRVFPAIPPADSIDLHEEACKIYRKLLEEQGLPEPVYAGKKQ